MIMPAVSNGLYKYLGEAAKFPLTWKTDDVSTVHLKYNGRTTQNRMWHKLCICLTKTE